MGGSRFLIENPRRGVSRRGRARGARRVSAANWGIAGGGAKCSQRARGSKKIILARTHEKTIPHAQNFHSRLKLSFSV